MISDRRNSRRHPVDLFVECRVPATATSAIMIDLSDSGCRIATREKLHLGQTVIVRFRGHKEIAGTVAWSKANVAGLRFSLALEDDELDELVEQFAVQRSSAA